MFVGGKELGKVPCLAICEEKKNSKSLMHCCDDDWGSIGVSGHDTVLAAKRRAELIYPESSGKWVEAHFTEEDVTRYLDEIWADHRCGFCGKGRDRADLRQMHRGIFTQVGKGASAPLRLGIRHLDGYAARRERRARMGRINTSAGIPKR